MVGRGGGILATIPIFFGTKCSLSYGAGAVRLPDPAHLRTREKEEQIYQHLSLQVVENAYRRQSEAWKFENAPSGPQVRPDMQYWRRSDRALFGVWRQLGEAI